MKPQTYMSSWSVLLLINPLGTGEGVFTHSWMHSINVYLSLYYDKHWGQSYKPDQYCYYFHIIYNLAQNRECWAQAVKYVDSMMKLPTLSTSTFQDVFSHGTYSHSGCHPTWSSCGWLQWLLGLQIQLQGDRRLTSRHCGSWTFSWPFY